LVVFYNKQTDQKKVLASLTASEVRISSKPRHLKILKALNFYITICTLGVRGAEMHYRKMFAESAKKIMKIGIVLSQKY
jgi:hypothetical protein